MCASTWRSRLVWSRAHDWKSCNRQKRFEGSNPSSSATAKKCEPRKRVRIFFVAAEEEFRMRTTPLNALIQGDLLRTDDENGQHVRRGSAARTALRFRPFLRLERGMKSAETLYLFGVLTLWRTSLRQTESRLNPRLCYFCIKGVAGIIIDTEVIDTEVYVPQLSDFYLTQKRDAHGNYTK